MILIWEEPEQAIDHLAWRAKMTGKDSPAMSELRVELRKRVIGRHSCTDVVLVVGADSSVIVSQNGRADYNANAWADRNTAVAEAIAAMEAYKAEHMYQELPLRVREAVDAAPHRF